MLGALKRSSLALSKQMGLTSAVAASEWRRRRLMILCYHGVALDDEHQWDPGLYVSPATLARRLAILERTGCRVLPLGEALTRLDAGSLPDRAVAITFDDGYHDFMARALPLLQQHHYPATVYLTTARCEHNIPVAHLLLSYLAWKKRGATLDATGLRGLDGVYPLATADQRAALVLKFRRAIEMWNAGEKDVVVEAVAARLGIDYGAILDRRILRLMTPDEVRGIAANPLADVQLHTHAHRTPADVDEFVAEIRENRWRIEAMTGRPAVHFCYPSGVYRQSYLPALAREGVISATTCDPGIATRTSHPLLLPRFVDTESITDLEFESWVTGAAHWLPRRTRTAHPAAA
jgi:peptidoglycan/xylan/chitin deacetylase (PgdA/CDA1 family)